MVAKFYGPRDLLFDDWSTAVETWSCLVLSGASSTPAIPLGCMSHSTPVAQNNGSYQKPFCMAYSNMKRSSGCGIDTPRDVVPDASYSYLTEYAHQPVVKSFSLTELIALGRRLWELYLAWRVTGEWKQQEYLHRFVVLAEAIYRVMIGGQGWVIYSTMLQGPCLLEGSLVEGVHFLSTFRAEVISTCSSPHDPMARNELSEP